MRRVLDKVRTDPASRKTPDIGALMADRWNPALKNVMGNFDARMVLDLMSEQSKGFFEALIQGNKLGDFDVLYDPRAYEQLNAGQRTLEKGKIVWDTWTSFGTKSSRGRPLPSPEERILSYRIDATLDPSFALHCLTSIQIEVTADSTRVIPFDFSGQMHATAAKVDGLPAEVYEREDSNAGDELLLVIPPQPLAPGTRHQVEIQHDGTVVQDSGNQVYFVSARGSWYPNRGLQFAKYDVTWHYPKELNMVSAGEVKEDRTDGDMRITRRVPDGPLRTLGFNLGKYDSKTVQRGVTRVEVYANHAIEAALTPRAPATTREVDPIVGGSTLPFRRPRPNDIQPVMTSTNEQAQARPADELARIASDVASAMDFYKARFGPPPLNYIEASPVPGRFGQGFAGMIYLSTLSYLPANAVPLSGMGKYQKTFFGELLLAHETATSGGATWSLRSPITMSG